MAKKFEKKNKSLKQSDGTQSTAQGRLIKLLKVISVVFAALILLFIAADRFGNITFSSVGDYFYSVVSGTKRGDGYPYYFESSTPKDVKKINSDLLVLTSDSTYVLDSTARKLSNITHSYSNPLIDCCNGRAILFDVGGFNYRVQSKMKVLYENTTQQKILTACVGKDGTVAVATRGEASASQLIVYSKNQKEIFRWDCAKDQIVSCDVSDNGQRVAVSVLGAENGELYSRVLIFDFDYQQPVFEYNFGTDTVSKVEFVDGYNLLASGASIMSFIDKKSNRVDIDLSLNSLSRQSTGENNLTAAVFSKYGSASSKILTVYNGSGSEKFTTEINSSVRSVSLEGSYISVLTDHQLMTYNSRGKLIGTSSVSADGISCFTDGGNIYVLTTGGINCFKSTGEKPEKTKDTPAE